ncbi:hypothetical protein [Flavobacterium sp. I3-2]|uniref:hypothetical protein n=1 Tax=Flavobacterium sp. I3-2 TaxID=2748319 RepID=UPI0015ACEF61|nr:hypothetical protein [Flavobacterium sp. I3-2]
MKKIIHSLLLFPIFSFAQIDVPIHCGYDFTSYFVVHPHEDGKSKTIDNLKISIVDLDGNEVINENNNLSWINSGKPLLFTRNYKINEQNKRIPITEEGKWFYYFANDHYLLTVSNTFPAENYNIKVEDVDGEENGGNFKTQFIPLASYNMYVLCTSEERAKAMQFGRKVTNKPLDIVMEKK